MGQRLVTRCLLARGGGGGGGSRHPARGAERRGRRPGGQAPSGGPKRWPQAERTDEAHGRGAATWDRAVRTWNCMMAGRLHSDALSSAVRRIWMLAALARLRPAMF